MFVQVHLYATLRRYAPADSKGVLVLELQSNETVGELLYRMGIDVGEIHIIMINGVSGNMESILHDNDRLGVFPPVGGG